MSRGSFDSVRREDVGTKERQERQERLNALKESRMEARRVRMETEQEDERKSKEIMKHNSEVGSPRKHTCAGQSDHSAHSHHGMNCAALL